MAAAAGLIFFVVWQSLAPNTSREPVEACSAEPQPAQGIYRLYDYDLNLIAPLTVRTAGGSNYFVKLVDSTTETPVMSFFINGGSELTINVPLGAFVLKYATGKSWCNERDLFGANTSTSMADKIFTFERKFTGDGYLLTRRTVELILQRGGNLQTITISPEKF